MHDYRLTQLISPDELRRHLDEMAERINKDYEGKSLVLIGILKGSFIFLADLARRLTVPVEIDFVRLASYGTKTETSGQIEITKDIELAVEGRDVLLVEDIIDTGTTVAWYLEKMQGRSPASIKICALIDKYERRSKEVPIDYVCIPLEKGFVVGYGLDFSERHRNLPGIYEVQFT
ncbi:hypoxanthine phosphoribosyltransferase [Desulfoferrobacter suflitae]|uniref:hypoxanthine phosphoribosyltransferase n=1 Tax=Desulfoferrobacter suflitae TaxID=2865782 RepID=UPI002164DCD0|nr:hypoxanthine phosphoribosyltransferase [Desulfoferrobacter suflitae]MCK8602706.1 hypoxanthine phosphoribosyltransferase [Desulfoferrobacter suflitae]